MMGRPTLGRPSFHGRPEGGQIWGDPDPRVTDSGLVGLTDFNLSNPRGHEGMVPREQKRLKGHPPRVIHHQVD